MRTGILGGTFDPVHLGHLLIAEESRISLGLDQVLFVPAGRPWLKEGQPLTEACHRVQMVELAVASNPHFRVIRNEVDRSGPSYTVDTLEELREELPATELFFILGLDAFESFHRWKDPGRILELCRLVVVSRPGYSDEEQDRLLATCGDQADRICVLPVHNVDFSATEIRRRASQGISFRYQVPDAVEAYISAQGLYRQRP
ncbi:MAG: nicotinate-nucleotide adenylyltransferase [Chloroflexi bacterium]|nr:nicotinate-nucleotide adenylyltransferase [Chloroflexota bacterium]